MSRTTPLVVAVLVILAGSLGVILADHQEPPVPSVSVAIGGPPRGLSPQFFGYNIDTSGVLENWSSSQWLGGLKKLSPGTLRYPGGTLANFWNWRTGWFFASTPHGVYGTLPEQTGYHFTLKDFRAGIHATGATPIFVLNMETATLGSQVAELHEAQRLGMAVRFVELGNEFYLPKKMYRKAFPSAADYADRAEQWSLTLHRDFPDVQIAVAGSPIASGPVRRETDWNSQVTRVITGNRALSLHLYWNPQTVSGARKDPWSTQVVSQVLQLPFYAWTYEVARVVNRLPADLPLWITEFNMMDRLPSGQWGPYQGTWTNGLFAGVMALLFLSDSRVSLIDYHSLIGGGFGAMSSPDGTLSPAGIVQSAVHEAGAGEDLAQPMGVDNATQRGKSISLGAHALVGWVFGTPAHHDEKGVWMNLTNRTIDVRLPRQISPQAKFQQWWGSPSARTADEIHKKTGTVGSTITLHPYAVLLVRNPPAH